MACVYILRFVQHGSKFNEHDAAIDSVRAEYQKDVKVVKSKRNVDSAYYSCDMQKVVMIPRMPG